MPVQSKICGITAPEALDAAVSGGATHIGFVFFAKSVRNILPEQAAALVARLPRHITPVALVVNEDANRIATIRAQTGIATVQLHGDEPPEFARALGGDVWKAIPVKSRADLSVAAYFKGAVSHILYDAKPPEGTEIPGGTGMRFDWGLLDGFTHPLPWILAGGLDAANVHGAIERTSANFVDVSSGVEDTPGEKSVDKITAFLKATQL